MLFLGQNKDKLIFKRKNGICQGIFIGWTIMSALKKMSFYILYIQLLILLNTSISLSVVNYRLSAINHQSSAISY